MPLDATQPSADASRCARYKGDDGTRILDSASIPSARPSHRLRHDSTSLSLLAGMNARTTADRLEHHSPAFTPERYTPVVQALDDDPADRLQAAFTQVRKKASEGS